MKAMIRDLSLRCHVPPLLEKPEERRASNCRAPLASRRQAREHNMVLAIDTETTVDLAQQLRFGVAQLYRLNRGTKSPAQSWVLYDHCPDAKFRTVTKQDIAVINQFAGEHGATALTVDDFLDKVFFKYAYKMKATVIGANLVFDLSRLASSHYYGRGQNSDGFGLRINRNLKPTWAPHTS